MDFDFEQQKLSIGYELIEDIYSDNNLIFLFELDAAASLLNAEYNRMLQFVAF